MTRETTIARTIQIMQRLNDDECAVLYAVAEQLDGAQRSPEYGPLRLAEDGRDFLAEAGAEAIDALAYLAMYTVRRRQHHGT